jgi:hypothetical protein
MRAATCGPRPIAAIGKPEFWPAAEALQDMLEQSWVPPVNDAHFWLLRLACTMKPPTSAEDVTEAQLALALQPVNGAAAATSTYAFLLHPDREVVDYQVPVTFNLSGTLVSPATGIHGGGQVSAKVQFRKVFPVIQSFGVGSPNPYWIFKPHANRPLEGSQFVYAVVAAQPQAEGLLGSIDLTVTVENQKWGGLIRFGVPRDAREQLNFTIAPENV